MPGCRENSNSERALKVIKKKSVEDNYKTKHNYKTIIQFIYCIISEGLTFFGYLISRFIHLFLAIT